MEYQKNREERCRAVEKSERKNERLSLETKVVLGMKKHLDSSPGPKVGCGWEEVTRQEGKRKTKKVVRKWCRAKSNSMHAKDFPLWSLRA